MRSKPGPPMTLANMRENGVRSVIASCANCGRSAGVNVDILPETLTVPEAGKRLRCSSCGGNARETELELRNLIDTVRKGMDAL